MALSLLACMPALVLHPAAVPARPVVAARTPMSPLMVDIPRIELPSAVTDVLKEQGLTNPNDMDDATYNAYSAAAIGGTLIFFILPLFDILSFFGDFIFSALVGGGLGAFVALNSGTSEYGLKFGNVLLEGADKAVPAVKELVDKIKKSV